MLSTVMIDLLPLDTIVHNIFFNVINVLTIMYSLAVLLIIAGKISDEFSVVMTICSSK